MFSILALTAASIFVNAQTTAPAVTIKGNGYTQTTPLMTWDESNSSDRLIGFGIRQEGGVKTNVLLYGKRAFDYRASLDDSATSYVDLDIQMSRKNASSSWLDNDFIRLRRSKVQPTATINGFILAFDIPDSIITDMRGWELKRFSNTIPGNESRYTTTSSRGVPEKVSKMFAAYLLKIPAGKSWFEPVAPFAKNKIPLTSLFHQSPEYIKGVLGAPVLDTNRNGTVWVRHITKHGTYELEYKDNMVVRIRLVPAYRFYPIHYSEEKQKSPFETIPRPAEIDPLGKSSCQHTALFPRRLKMSPYIGMERNEQSEDEEKRRYITLVEVKEEY